MDQLQEVTKTIAMTMGVAWASGINLYAAILVLGVLGASGNMTLPPGLELLTNPLVIAAAGLMYVVEFFADKIPGVDSAWDALHTFIRIPAGALLAAAAIGDVDPAVSLAAGLVGGLVTAGTHAGKAASRVLINTSPEPFTNSIASLTEDAAVFGGMWLSIKHPALFLVLFVAFVTVLAWALPRLWRGVKIVFAKVRAFFGGKTLAPSTAVPPTALPSGPNEDERPTV